jgi:hypothetical protein
MYLAIDIQWCKYKKKIELWEENLYLASMNIMFEENHVQNSWNWKKGGMPFNDANIKKKIELWEENFGVAQAYTLKQVRKTFRISFYNL